MVDLSEAGARLREYRPEPTPSVAVIVARRDRRRRRRRVTGGLAGLAFVAAVVVVAVAVISPRHTRTRIATASGGGRRGHGAAVSATAASLAAGRWSTMPAAPVPARLEPSVLWTGSELIVWGGYSVNPERIYGDGAAYNPTTNRWRVLPPSPLGARNGQTAVWTGSEMVVWGGYDQENPSLHVTADGAAFDPTTNKWKMLPPAPLSARADARGVWTGRGVFILGGHPDVVTSAKDNDTDGALYDPTSNIWHHVAAPGAPGDHGLLWWMAVRAGDQVLAWSEWFTQPTSTDESAIGGGVDLFTYNEQSGQWRLVPTGADPVQGMTEAIWTGRYVVVRGTANYCPSCNGPAPPESTALYDPTHQTWTAIPADPLALVHPLSVWTGAALLSIDVSGTAGTTKPGDSTAYDPTSRQWVTLPSAPYGCDDLAPPFGSVAWTGRQVVLYCQTSSPTQNGNGAGLVLTPGP